MNYYWLCIEFRNTLTDKDLTKKGLYHKVDRILWIEDPIKTPADYDKMLDIWAKNHEIYRSDFVVVGFTKLT